MDNSLRLLERAHIGIDPGVQTGIAILDATTKRLLVVETQPILRAMEMIDTLRRDVNPHITIIMEDARLRTWYGKHGKEVLQGVGSVKRDCAIWEEYAERNAIAFRPVAPQGGLTKLTADRFAKITGWPGSTSHHARDAAMLVWSGR